MHIGFDAKRLFNNNSGLRNYAQNIIEALVRYYPQNTYTLFTPSFNPAIIEELPYLNSSNIHIITPDNFIQRKLHAIWRSRGVVKTKAFKELDIYHGLSNEMPLHSARYVKTVVTIHDVIFRHYPEYYNASDRRVYDAKTHYAVKHAHEIIALNHQTIQDLVKFYNGNPDHIHFMEQPVKPDFIAVLDNDVINKVLTKYQLPKNFILYVGTIEPRKNLVLIINALSLIPEVSRPHLLVVGRRTPYLDYVKAKIVDLHLHEYITFMHHTSNEELSVINKLASLYVNPSLLEGFGAPILEALTTGTQVLCTDAPFFKDTFKEKCTYAPIENIELWAQLIKELSAHPVKTNYDLSAFTHVAVANKLMTLYQQLK